MKSSQACATPADDAAIHTITAAANRLRIG
jgi:hypothetical protein